MARILVIDDDEIFRVALKDMLVASGHTVTAAPDGLEGCVMYRADPPDLLITDMMMPYGGLAAIQVLRRQFPDLRVLAMTGASAHRLHYATGLGARATLTKPFTPAKLAAAIDVALASGTVEPSAPVALRH
jgi:CheY-like chemotaxis protein